MQKLKIYSVALFVIFISAAIVFAQSEYQPIETTFVYDSIMVNAVNAQDDEIESEIREASLAWDEAFNAADVEQVMDLYADDVISMPPNLPMRQGKEELQADFEWIFENFNAQHETIIFDILVSDDLVIELGQYTMTFDPHDGSDDFDEAGTHILVRQLIDGEWKIVWEIWNTDE